MKGANCAAVGRPTVLAFQALLLISQTVEADVDYSCAHAKSWFLNEESHYDSNYNVLTDVTSSSLDSNEWKVTTNHIPRYDHVITDDDMDFLNGRPKASTDFKSGSTTVSSGDTVSFGQDIGYGGMGCDMGYWPPGPDCPDSTTKTYTWDLTPAPETRTDGCYMKIVGAIGYWVNGVSIFGPSDATSYKNQDVWFGTALGFELYDLDVCGGHAAMGEYHHHQNPYCIQEMLGDTSEARNSSAGHSPIYGWMLDGYPIYGPYQDNMLEAESCWQKRSYLSSSETGCDVDNERSCVLTDPFDYTQGTTDVTSGPKTTGSVQSLSGNTIDTVSGVYIQDYYYNSSCTTQGGAALDEYSGHDHDDLGYHYHVTSGFPWVGGPKYKGCQKSGSCCTSVTDKTCSGTSSCGTPQGNTTFGCSQGSRPVTDSSSDDESESESDNFCFHIDTVVSYRGAEYGYEELKAGAEPECTIPHSPRARGVVIFTSCNKTVRVTDTHLLSSPTGFRQAFSLKPGDVLFGDFKANEECEVTSVEKETSLQQYFGLNCIHSEVLANGILASTFGDFHALPAWFMHYVGGLIGLTSSSYTGDIISEALYSK